MQGMHQVQLSIAENSQWKMICEKYSTSTWIQLFITDYQEENKQALKCYQLLTLCAN